MLTEDSIGIQKKLWRPAPTWSRLRRETVAIVYHWAAMTTPEKTTQQNMHDYLWRHMKNKAYHAIVQDEIWQVLHWEMTSGALGLNNLEDYPETTKRRFDDAWPDTRTINILMMELDREGRCGIRTMNNAMLLGAYLCQRYELHPTEHILRHSDVTGKGVRPQDHRLYKPNELPCPRFYVESPQAWEVFRIRIKEVLCIEGDDEGRHFET